MVEDNDIVDLFWERKESAITETANKYGKYCFTIAFNILSNTQDAEECVNDTYMNSWNSIPPHRPSVLATFLGKITRFTALKKWRDKRTQKRGSGEADLVYEELSACILSGTGLDEELDFKEMVAIINHFLKSLPTVDRRVFVCRYWYFDSIYAISQQFCFSESKVKSMLHRTRVKLESTLKKEGFF